MAVIFKATDSDGCAVHAVGLVPGVSIISDNKNNYVNTLLTLEQVTELRGALTKHIDERSLAAGELPKGYDIAHPDTLLPRITKKVYDDGKYADEEVPFASILPVIRLLFAAQYEASFDSNTSKAMLAAKLAVFRFIFSELDGPVTVH